MADGWRSREAALLEALTELGQRHDLLNLTAPVRAVPSQFFDRSSTVLWCDRFCTALREAISEPSIR